MGGGVALLLYGGAALSWVAVMGGLFAVSLGFLALTYKAADKAVRQPRPKAQWTPARKRLVVVALALLVAAGVALFVLPPFWQPVVTGGGFIVFAVMAFLARRLP